MDTGILTQLLDDFLFVISGGFLRLQADVYWLLDRLIVLELVLVSLWWAFAREDILVSLLQKCLAMGFVVFAVLRFPQLLEVFLNTLAEAGLKAGGSGMTRDEFLNPSEIAWHGFQLAVPIFEVIGRYSGWSALSNLHNLIVLGLCGVMVVLAFFFVGIQVFVTLLEFYIAAVCGLFLLPFGVFRPTAFIAERVFGMVLSFGVKLMVLAFISSMAFPVIVTIQFNADPGYKEAFALLLGAFALAILAWQAPNVAAGLMAGTPSLSAGAVAGGALAAVAGASVASQAGRSAGRLAAGTGRAAYGLSRGAVSAGSAVGTSYTTGSATPGGGSSIGGGLRGVGRLAMSPAANLAQRVGAGYQQAAAAGRLYGWSATGGSGPSSQGGGSSGAGAPGGAGAVIANRRSGIYHQPGMPNYGDVAPSNRETFSSTAAAEAAGFRPARNTHHR